MHLAERHARPPRGTEPQRSVRGRHPQIRQRVQHPSTDMVSEDLRAKMPLLVIGPASSYARLSYDVPRSPGCIGVNEQSLRKDTTLPTA